MTNTLADVKRASHVINACLKHGLGYFIHIYGLKWHLSFINKVFLRKPTPPKNLPQRIRAVMEELGGAYIKLGQVLSIRPDLIPSEYCREFKQLQDDTTPLPFATITSVIETELKQSLSTYFSDVTKTPLGSASIAQVHHAKLTSGRNVVIKVQRPNIQEQFREDIDILYYLARKIEHHWENKALSPTEIIHEFERASTAELNFTTEATHLDAFYKAFKNSATIKIPKVFWHLTTPRVLVMEYLDGIKLSEAQKLTPTQKKLLAYRIMDCGLKQLFELGFFHADMHPGNILILPGNKIGLIDFGIVGTVPKERLHELVLLYVAVVQQNTQNVIENLISISTITSETNVEGFKQDVTALFSDWYSTTGPKMRTTQIMELLFQTCIKYNLKIPKDLVLFGKATMTTESTCIDLYPDFDFVTYAKPKVVELLKKQHTPTKIIKEFLIATAKVGQNLAALPETAVSLMKRLEREPLRIGVNTTDVRHLGFDIDTSSNRLSYALLIAALIVAGSLLIHTEPSYAHYSLISIAAFLSAGILFVPFLVSVLREGTKRYDAHNG